MKIGDAGCWEFAGEGWTGKEMQAGEVRWSDLRRSCIILLIRYGNYYWTEGQCWSREEKLARGETNRPSGNAGKVKTKTHPLKSTKGAASL